MTIEEFGKIGFETIKECQKVLADYSKPENINTDKHFFQLFAILDDEKLVEIMNEVEKGSI